VVPKRASGLAVNRVCNCCGIADEQPYFLLPFEAQFLTLFE
jgi:hypothetical protein